jgi:Raf kinase inhibitor-like YbhB/YbcL family protein
MKTTAVSAIKVSSNAFKHNQFIASVYTCDGTNINPALVLDQLPEGTESIAVIVDDPDAPKGTFTHWLIWNIKPASFINENAHDLGVEGTNDFGKAHYMGPCPPHGTHRYFFKVYALESFISLNAYSRKEALLSAIEDRVIGYGELVGLYSKNE